MSMAKYPTLFHAHDLHTGNMLICILFDKRPQCASTSACFFLEKKRELSTKTEQMRSSDAFCKLMENGVPRFFVADLFPQNKWRESKTVSNLHCAKTEHCVASLFKQLKRSSPFCFVTQDQETIGKKNSTRSQSLFAPSALLILAVNKRHNNQDCFGILQKMRFCWPHLVCPNDWVSNICFTTNRDAWEKTQHFSFFCTLVEC